ncbi:MAG: hypothetical protein ACW99G_09895, partial [Candidatus Thorarchaeota archaeon]
MTKEKKSGKGWIVTKLCIVFVVTLMSSYISFWMLSNVPFELALLKLQALLLSSILFLFGSMFLAFSEQTINKFVVYLSGFVITIGAILIGGVLVLIQIVLLYPVEAMLAAGIPATLLLLWYTRKVVSSPENTNILPDIGVTVSRRVMKKDWLIGAVELTEFPEDHLMDKNPDQTNQQPFFNVLRVMVMANFPVALRYERVRNKLRMLYLTWAKNDVDLSENLETLADTVKGNLIGFKRKIHDRFHAPTMDTSATPVSSYILGEPLSVDDTRQRIDAMTVMAEVLLGLPSGIFQVSVIPRRSSARAVKSLEKQFRDESERSQLTISKSRSTLFSGEVQESKTRTNMGAIKKAESLQIQIERLSNSHLCEVEVSATCWDRDPKKAERNAKKLAGVLRGTLLPADPQKHLSIETDKNPHKAKKLMEGGTIGKTTLLSLEETSVYFSLARNDLGISVADHASFRTNPTTRRISDKGLKSPDTKHGLRLGKVMDDSGVLIEDFVIPT